MAGLAWNSVAGFDWNEWPVYVGISGSIAPEYAGGQRRKLRESDEAVLKQLVEEHADATLSELNQWLKAKTGVVVSDATIGLSLRRGGITRKKLSYHAN